MTTEAIVLLAGALTFGLAGAVYARWSRWRLERDGAGSPARAALTAATTEAAVLGLFLAILA